MRVITCYRFYRKRTNSSSRWFVFSGETFGSTEFYGELQQFSPFLNNPKGHKLYYNIVQYIDKYIESVSQYIDL
jgi:hypothetical protein